MVGLSIVDGVYIKCRRPRQQLQIGFIRRRRRSESNYVSLCKCVHSICIHELDYDRTKSPKHVHTNKHTCTHLLYLCRLKQTANQTIAAMHNCNRINLTRLPFLFLLVVVVVHFFCFRFRLLPINSTE